MHIPLESSHSDCGVYKESRFISNRTESGFSRICLLIRIPVISDALDAMADLHTASQMRFVVNGVDMVALLEHGIGAFPTRRLSGPSVRTMVSEIFDNFLSPFNTREMWHGRHSVTYFLDLEKINVSIIIASMQCLLALLIIIVMFLHQHPMFLERPIQFLSRLSLTLCFG